MQSKNVSVELQPREDISYSLMHWISMTNQHVRNVSSQVWLCLSHFCEILADAPVSQHWVWNGVDGSDFVSRSCYSNVYTFV